MVLKLFSVNTIQLQSVLLLNWLSPENVFPSVLDTRGKNTILQYIFSHKLCRISSNKLRMTCPSYYINVYNILLTENNPCRLWLMPVGPRPIYTMANLCPLCESTYKNLTTNRETTRGLQLVSSINTLKLNGAMILKVTRNCVDHWQLRERKPEKRTE